MGVAEWHTLAVRPTLVLADAMMRRSIGDVSKLTEAARDVTLRYVAGGTVFVTIEQTRLAQIS